MNSSNSFEIASMRWSAFRRGRVFAPIAGIVSTVSPVSGSRWWRAHRSPKSSIRPISMWTGTFPMRVCLIPRSGSEVLVLFGNRRHSRKDRPNPAGFRCVREARSSLLARDRPATQIARIRFDPDATPPPLNSTARFTCTTSISSAGVADRLVRIFGPV